jgi:hypothetical protein
MMHRTTVFIPDELHVKLRGLACRTRTSLSLLLEVAAGESFAALLGDPPDESELARWDTTLRQERIARDQRFRWNRRARRGG